MAAKKRGLGRGLDALLASTQSPLVETAPIVESEEKNSGNLNELPLEYIQRGKYQPRKDMHPQALEELAASIKLQGVMQPIVVRPIAEQNRYEIIAGERRWRACQLAGLDNIPVIIRDVPDDAAVAMALIENIQREDLNPVEEATALLRLQQEFELTQQQVADAVGKSRTTVTNLLRLMNLKEEVRRLLEHGDLEMGHARALLALSENDQIEAAKTVVAKGLSVRQTESLVRRLQTQTEDKKQVFVKSADIKQLEEKLSERIGAPVMIQHTVKGKGKLVLKYNSLDELDGILNHIK